MDNNYNDDGDDYQNFKQRQGGNRAYDQYDDYEDLEQEEEEENYDDYNAQQNNQRFGSPYVYNPRQQQLQEEQSYDDEYYSSEELGTIQEDSRESQSIQSINQSQFTANNNSNNGPDIQSQRVYTASSFAQSKYLQEDDQDYYQDSSVEKQQQQDVIKGQKYDQFDSLDLELYENYIPEDAEKYEFKDFSDEDTVSGISNSVQSLFDRELLNLPDGKIKTDNENFWVRKEKMQRQFQAVVNQQTKILDDRQKIEKIKDKLNYKFDKIDENQMKQVLHEIELQDQDEANKKIIPKRYKHKYEKRDYEKLVHETEFLKKQHNEDQTQIRLLKVELRKLTLYKNNNNNVKKGQQISSQNDNLSINKSQLSAGDSRSTMDSLQESNLRLADDVKKLRKELQIQDQTYKTELSKLQKLNLEMQKGYMKEIKDLEKRSNFTISDQKMHAKLRKQEKQVTQLRLFIDQQNKKIEGLNEIIKKKNEEICKANSVRNEKTVIKQDFKIQELQKKIDDNEEDKIEIRQTYALDNQLKLLFPKKYDLLANLMNGVLVIEEFEQKKEQKAFSTIIKTTKPIHRFFKQGAERMIDYVKYYKSKNIVDHPNYKEVAKAQLKIWNQNPSIMAKEINTNQVEIKTLKDQVIMMLKEKDVQQQFIENLNKDVDSLQRRNDVLEEKLKYDRIQLARQLIVFYMGQEKGEDMECFTQLKEYIDILEKPLGKTFRQRQKEIKEKQEKEEELQKQKEQEELDKKRGSIARKKMTYNYLKPLKKNQESNPWSKSNNNNKK